MKNALVRNKDLRLLPVLALGLLLVAAKLVLCTSQQVFLWPDEAVLDDMVMYNGAVSITEGDWLGPYGWKTLSKHSFFSLWVAGLHAAGIPYLLGGQLLWAAAAFAAAWAFMPALKKRWLGLLLFGVLWFNPAATANPENVNGTALVGFTTRVYRDNIFPALCLLCVAGMAGFALRWHRPLRYGMGFLALAGAGFAACWLTREDGWWLLPFVLAAAVVCAVFVLRGGDGPKAKALRCAALLLPFALLAGGVLGWCGMNQARYGRFIVSDFAGGEFADAYGAMTRIEHESWEPKVAVPADVRQKLYAHVPAFAELEPLLEGEWYRGRYAKEDYNSGSFYWALREAAAERGHYDTPEKARQYFQGLAADINALCDSGALAAGPARSSVNPPIRAEYLGPVLAEGLYSLWFCATFRQCQPYSMYSPGANDAAYYSERLAPMEDFLREEVLAVTLENSTRPYYSPWQRLCYLVFDGIRAVYAVLVPAALLAALAWQVWGGARLLGRLRRRQKDSGEAMLWLVCLGLWCCVLLRAFMVAFVTVSSFDIGTFVMYLASIHPLMLTLAVVGAAQLARLLAARRRPGKVPVGGAPA